MDVAASEFFKDGVCVLSANVREHCASYCLSRYDLDFKNPASAPESKISGAALADMYRSFIADYPIVSIEDPFDQDDFASYTALTASVKEQIVRACGVGGSRVALCFAAQCHLFYRHNLTPRAAGWRRLARDQSQAHPNRH
jgi:hypothetical protein